MEYEFDLKFKLPATVADTAELVERMGKAGCDDAVVGVGQPGRVALRFAREADSAKRAIVSALRDVKKAIPHAQLVEAGPDLVGLTDVAEMLGMTRQNMRKLMLTHGESFPSPIHEGSAVIWHLEPILQWLKRRGGYEIDQQLIDVAHVMMQINLIKESDRLVTAAQREFRPLLV